MCISLERATKVIRGRFGGQERTNSHICSSHTFFWTNYALALAWNSSWACNSLHSSDPSLTSLTFQLNPVTNGAQGRGNGKQHALQSGALQGQIEDLVWLQIMLVDSSTPLNFSTSHPASFPDVFPGKVNLQHQTKPYRHGLASSHICVGPIPCNWIGFSIYFHVFNSAIFT